MMSALIAEGIVETHKFNANGSDPDAFYIITMDDTTAAPRLMKMAVQVTDNSASDFVYTLTIQTTDPNGVGTPYSESHTKHIDEVAEYNVTCFDSSTTFTFSVSTPQSCAGAISIMY